MTIDCPDSLKMDIEVVVMKNGERIAEEKFKAFTHDEARTHAYAIATLKGVEVNLDRTSELWLEKKAFIKIWG